MNIALRYFIQAFLLFVDGDRQTSKGLYTDRSYHAEDRTWENNQNERIECKSKQTQQKPT